MKLFSGNANRQLAQKIADTLNISLSKTEVSIFPDGEKRIQITQNVVDEHVFILQTANTPVDMNYMELFFLIDALKRSGAEFVTAIVPYFGYQRQDHIFRDGEAVSLEVIIKIIQTLGADRVVSLDMHSVRIPDMFTIPVSHLSALPKFAASIIHNGWNGIENILVSPDMGGIARIKKLSEYLDGMDYAYVEKNRDLNSGLLTASGVYGNLKRKKRAIIVDDMISSGKTIVLAAQELLHQGIETVSAFATHAIFTEESSIFLKTSPIENFFVTDTVLIPPEKQFAQLTILSIAEELAKEVQTILHDY